MRTFDYQKAATLKEAFDTDSRSGGDSVFMAGGTDVLVKVKRGDIRPLRVIDIKGIPDMDGFSVTGNQFSIGP